MTYNVSSGTLSLYTTTTTHVVEYYCCFYNTVFSHFL